MKAAKQSKQRPCCVHLIENSGEVKRGDAEKTVILDYKTSSHGTLGNEPKMARCQHQKEIICFQH